MQQVGHGLCGMVEVALQVDNSRPYGQHTTGGAVVECFAYLAHVFVAFAQVHVVADADKIR